MAKVLTIFLILLTAYLFYPFRDLYIQTDPFSPDYKLISRGFWTLDACVQAASSERKIDFICRKKSSFSRMTGTFSKYGEAKNIQ